jgi:hypothetical protein
MLLLYPVPGSYVVEEIICNKHIPPPLLSLPMIVVIIAKVLLWVDHPSLPVVDLAVIVLVFISVLAEACEC